VGGKVACKLHARHPTRSAAHLSLANAISAACALVTCPVACSCHTINGRCSTTHFINVQYVLAAWFCWKSHSHALFHATTSGWARMGMMNATAMFAGFKGPSKIPTNPVGTCLAYNNATQHNTVQKLAEGHLPSIRSTPSKSGPGPKGTCQAAGAHAAGMRKATCLQRSGLEAGAHSTQAVPEQSRQDLHSGT
jgi:hypothetical protein